MISLKKPLGSLESPLLSGAGLCDMAADCDVCRKIFLCRGQLERIEIREETYKQDRLSRILFGLGLNAQCANVGYG